MAEMTSSQLNLQHNNNAKNSLSRVKSLPYFIFLKELLSNPRNIGAACPSSKKLAKGIASCVQTQDGYVVELGAGTGVVTSALLKRGIEPQRLIVIEKSPYLAELLKKKFPQITIIEGDAVALNSLLNQKLKFQNPKITTFVSSLPLRTLPDFVVEQIMQQIAQTITENGELIQFTYDIRRSRSPLFQKFATLHTKLIWRNLPPARIHIYRKTADFFHQPNFGNQNGRKD
jgi:phospholipid N-methyltransferase